MAIIPATMEVLGEGLIRVTWAAMNTGDSGEPVRTAAFSDRTIQAIGNATSVAVFGSNDGTNSAALSDAGGTVISLDPSAFDLVMIRENPLFIWPAATGGTDTDVILIGCTDR